MPPAEPGRPGRRGTASTRQCTPTTPRSRSAAPAAIGFGTLIMDDGWQTADTGRDYPYCGDWEPEPSKFPDMPANVSACTSSA